MTNSEEGKKIVEVLRLLQNTITKYHQLPQKSLVIRDALRVAHEELCIEHVNLCCSKCKQYNDECSCP